MVEVIQVHLSSVKRAISRNLKLSDQVGCRKANHRGVNENRVCWAGVHDEAERVRALGNSEDPVDHCHAPLKRDHADGLETLNDSVIVCWRSTKNAWPHAAGKGALTKQALRGGIHTSHRRRE
jgi:hypothetical protein